MDTKNVRGNFETRTDAQNLHFLKSEGLDNYCHRIGEIVTSAK